MIRKKKNQEGLYLNPNAVNVRTHIHRQIIRGKMMTIREVARNFRITCKELEKICNSNGSGIVIYPSSCLSKSFIDLDDNFYTLENIDEEDYYAI